MQINNMNFVLQGQVTSFLQIGEKNRTRFGTTSTIWKRFGSSIFHIVTKIIITMSEFEVGKSQINTVR